MRYYSSDECIACRKCVEVCPAGAPRYDGDRFVISPELCIGCGVCAANCPAGAIYPEHSQPPEKPEASRQSRTERFDIVVIGAGPAGLACAAYCAEHGKRVAVLEASKLPGGAGVHATGFNTWDTQWQKDAGAPEFMEDYIRGAMAVTKNQLDYGLISAAYRANSSFFDWFCTFGSAEACFCLADSPAGKSVQVRYGEQMAGPYICGKLYAHCAGLGVIFHMQCRASALLRTEDGRVTGVKAADEQGTLIVFCSACLIAAGNMSENPELGEFLPEFAAAAAIRNPHRQPYARGDGVRMVRDAGIAVDTSGVASHFLGAMPAWFDGHVLKQGLRPEGVRVNLNGQRFVSEDIDRFDAVDKLLRQPQCVSFHVIDTFILNQPIQPIRKFGITSCFQLEDALPGPRQKVSVLNFLGMTLDTDADGNPIPLPMEGLEEGRGMGNYPPGSLPDPERLKAYTNLKGGHVCAADTIEELARQMGVPEQPLTQTIARYNQMCRTGHDTEQGKHPSYLLPLHQPPYYAFKCFLGTDGVFGGISIDAGCRVIDHETRAVVPGLYAAGDNTSGNFIKENSHRTEVMGDFTWANTSGFLAANTILRDLG